MAEERERRQVGETDELSEDKAAEPDVEAHKAATDRKMVGQDDDRDAEADEGRERRK